MARASRAASCSAAFFDGPFPTPASSPSITAAQVNVRSCGGPFDVEHRVRDREAAPRECLLELRLVVDVGRQRVLDPARESSDDCTLDPPEPVLEEKGSECRLQEGREDVAVRGEALELVLRHCVGRPLGHPVAEPELAGDNRAARS